MRHLSAPIEPVGEVLLPEQQSYHRVLHPARGETVQETRVVLLRSRHTAEAMAAGQVEATASGQGPAESINWAVVLYGGRPPSEHQRRPGLLIGSNVNRWLPARHGILQGWVATCSVKVPHHTQDVYYTTNQKALGGDHVLQDSRNAAWRNGACQLGGRTVNAVSRRDHPNCRRRDQITDRDRSAALFQSRECHFAAGPNEQRLCGQWHHLSDVGIDGDSGR